MKKKFELNDTLFLIDGEYYLVDKEAKIVKGDWCYDSKHNQIFQWNGEGNLLKITHKVTASTKSLEGIHHFSIEDENFSKLCSVSYDKLIKRINGKVNPYDYRFGLTNIPKDQKEEKYKRIWGRYFRLNSWGDVKNDSDIGFIGIRIIGYSIGFIILFFNVSILIKIIIAPKIYLIEYFLN